MPTGLTCGISEGMVFKEFVLSCSKQFGALIHMKDLSSDTPIIKQEIDPYYSESVKKAEKDYNNYIKLSQEEKERRMKDEWISGIDHHKKEIIKRRKLEEKYIEMLKKVKNWISPSEEHIKLKQFMIDQINDSIKYDCITEYHYKTIKRYDGYLCDEETIKIQIYEFKLSLSQTVTNAIESEVAHIEAVKKNNKWVSQLIESLKDV